MTDDEKKTVASVVGALFVFALCVALAGSAPDPVPDWALRREAVFRAEVALAIFIALYVPVAAIALARQGRLFTKFGAGPASAEAEALTAADENTQALEALRTSVQQVSGSTISTFELVAHLRERVDRLETELKNRGVL